MNSFFLGEGALLAFTSLSGTLRIRYANNIQMSSEVFFLFKLDGGWGRRSENPEWQSCAVSGREEQRAALCSAGGGEALRGAQLWVLVWSCAFAVQHYVLPVTVLAVS